MIQPQNIFNINCVRDHHFKNWVIKFIKSNLTSFRNNIHHFHTDNKDITKYYKWKISTSIPLKTYYLGINIICLQHTRQRNDSKLIRKN